MKPGTGSCVDLLGVHLHILPEQDIIKSSMAGHIGTGPFPLICYSSLLLSVPAGLAIPSPS